MRLRILAIVLLSSMLMPAGSVPAAPACSPPPHNELERRLLADAADGALDGFSLFEAALIAAGLDREDEVARRWQAFHKFCEEIRNQLPPSPPSARAQALFQIMHDRFLTGQYRSGCSGLADTLDRGHFDCVTATILYHCLCEQFDLCPRIMATSDHVYSRVALAGVGDVQTTCAEWFRIPEKRRGHAASPPGSPSDVELREKPACPLFREISPVQLLGKIYYNSGVAQFEAGEFAQAVRALEIGVSLDPQDRAARDNLLAALNNWSLAESDAGNYVAAAGLLHQGLQLDAHYAPCLANDLHIHQKWALALCQARKYAAALDLLERCHARRPEAELFDVGRLAVVGLWAESLLDQGRFDEAWAVFEDARRWYPQSPELARYEEAAIHDCVASLASQGRHKEAVSLSTVGLKRQPQSQRLLRQHQDLTRPQS